ncbi:MAG: gliding motility-associated C-terminal domain-containing protein [Bacteroidota bacterium]
MRTLHLFRYIVKPMIYTLILFWSSLTLAQCPTINSQPPIICDAAGLTFADLNSFVTDQGNGIVWYDAPTNGSPYNSNELLSEGTFYAGDTTGSCGTRPAIIVDFEVDPSGQNLDAIYCSNENPTFQDYTDDVLTPNLPPGGSVEVYSDIGLTTMVNPTDGIPMGANSYFVVFIDNGGCRSQIELGNTAVFGAPADPTPPSVQSFCSDTNPTVGDLNPGTPATINWFDSIDGAGNPIPPALSLLTPLVNGNTYYVQITDIFCDSNPVPVTVVIDDPSDAGTSAILEYCNDNLPATDFNLFDELTGTPDTNGVWSGPLPTSNGHLGTVNISSLVAANDYVFTYTITSNNACPDSVSSVTIRVYAELSSGTVAPSSPALFCEADLPSGFDLFSLLDNEDAGGIWVQGTNNTDPQITSPADLTGFAPGTYDFTYFQNLLPNPCNELSTTVQVTVLEDPNAGLAVNALFCENELVSNSPYDLFNALDGSQDNNSGTWTDSNGVTVINPIDITGFTTLGSPYEFTYTIDNGTCTDSETITITIEDAPESGTVNSTPEFCEGEAPASFDLFDLLDGEDQAGVWHSGGDNTGPIVTNPVDLSGLSSGTYNYTYDVNAIGNCDDVLVTVSIIINPLPNTGIATPLTLCENELAANSPLDLFGQLSGNDSGGTWTDDSGSGALTGNTVDLTALAIGSYDFTYSITDANNCSNSTTVTITVEDAPESGTANPALEICLVDITAGQTQDLFDLLDGEDQTGTWSDDDSSGALTGNTVTLDGLATGTYNFTYDVAAIGSCDDVLVTVTIIIQDIPEPSGDATQEFCDSATVADLVATGQGIQWYDSLTSTTPLDGATALIDGQTYYATQTDQVTNCESSNRLAVNVVINIAPNSGNPSANPIIACNDNNTIDLNTGLDGTQDAGGQWIDTDGTGALTGNILDATSLAVGSYDFEYFIAGLSLCPDASTTITVTIEAPLNAGSDNVLDICTDEAIVDLFTLLGGADTGGTWSPALTSNTGVFDPTVDPSGTYTYTLQNACGIYSSDIVVTVTAAPDAGGDNTISVCTIDGPVDLTTQLTGTPDTNGTWSPALASGTNIFDPTVDASGTYTYTVLAVSPCASDATAELSITVDDSNPPTVIDANPAFCQVDNPIVSDLNAVVSATGTVNWYADSTLTTALLGTEPLVDGEDYYATQTNTTGCESSQNVVVNVSVSDSPTPSLISPLNELCINDNPTIDDLTLNILEFDASIDNVLWYEEEQGGSPLSASDLLLPNTTYYAVLVDPVSGCESSLRLEFTPDLTACGALIFPDGFSPNGDGVNDTYDIDNLDVLVPNFEMEIYNRYGNLIYRGNAASPRFNGKSNQSGTIDGDLPVGVYFYIFRYNNGINKPIQGSLYLSR